MNESSRLPGVPLRDAHDPTRFGEETALLALLAADGSVGVAPGLALDAEAVSVAAGGSDGASRWEEAWGLLGRPRHIAVRSGEITDPDPDGPLPLITIPVRDGASLRTAVREASAAQPGPLFVQADPQATARGVAYSEDPREDRIDEIHIDAWPAEGRAAVRYRRGREGGRWTLELPDGGQVVLPSPALESILAALRLAELMLGEAIALHWTWSAPRGDGAGAVTIVGVAPQGSPLPWAIYRGAEKENDAWSRGNAGEVIAGPVTPMTWSMIGEPLDSGFAAMFPESWRGERRFFALFRGYAYFNLGQVYHLAIDRMGGPTRAMLSVVGGPGDARALGVAEHGLRWSAILRSFPSIVASTRRQQALPGRWPAEREVLTALRDEIAAVDAVAVDTQTIAAAIENIYEAQRPHVRFFMEAQGAAFTGFAMLRHLCEWFLAEPALANRLVQGLPDVMTAEINLRLWRLAERAAAHAETRTVVVENAPTRLLATLREHEGSAWLADELESFLEDHAHRGTAELELLTPRWADDPTPVLSSFQSYARNPEQNSVEALVDRQRLDREAAQREVDARLTAHWWERAFPLRRAVLRHYAHWARRYAPLRENPKAAVLTVSHETRKLLRIAGRRFAEQGVLREQDDVLFLDRAELGALAAAEGNGDEEATLTIGRLRRRVARRRRFYREALERTPSPIIGDLQAAEENQVIGGEDGRNLRGLAASRGVAESRARVLSSPGRRSGCSRATSW